MIGRDHAKGIARSAFAVFCAAAVLLCIYFGEYALGWIRAEAYVANAYLLVGIAAGAALSALPWVVLVVADAARRNDPLGPVTPRPVEGERARLAGAVDESTSTPPAAPGQTSSSLATSPGDEAVSPATTRDVRAVAGDASNFPALIAGNGPLEC